VVLLLYLLLQVLLEGLSNAREIAFVSALLFAVHPIHSEAVAWITGRSELLAAGLLLAAWLCHLKDRPIGALLCLGLAVLSKESAITFPALVIAGDYTRGQLKPLRRYAWIAAVTGACLFLVWHLKGGRFGPAAIDVLDNPLASLPARLRILNAVRIGWKYVGLLAYPGTLACDYSYNAILLYTSWKHIAVPVLAALGGLGLWIWALRTGRNAWVLAGAIYVGAFALTANIVMPIGTIMGERLAYLPSAGFCLAVGLLWAQLKARRTQLAWVVLGVIVLALGARTLVRNLDWKDDFTLYSSGVKVSPSSAKIHRNLADEYGKRGQLDAARHEYQAALRIYPAFPEALENYGLLEARTGDSQQATNLLRKAVAVTPSGNPHRGFLETNLAAQLAATGNRDEALQVLSQATVEFPRYAPVWSSRAVLRYRSGDLDGARSDAQAALRLDPIDTQARSVLGSLQVLDKTPAIR